MHKSRQILDFDEFSLSACLSACLYFFVRCVGWMNKHRARQDQNLFSRIRLRMSRDDFKYERERERGREREREQSHQGWQTFLWM